ncbi:hypothetical protein JCGZ_06705 [Jatropha curcas]|uniref:Pentatricopeptide repeat-containing protein n=1 Tax=Jatropha curcas TaxID=180498 RepID=A0A067KS50_JATCU|nr:hypothetical protein JCGZ_06705 [Jatropha curcas]
MDSLNQPITTEIYSSLIKECILRSDSRGALLLHSRLVNQSSLKMTLYLFHLLLYMHLSFGHFDIARNLFDKMPHRKDFLSWAIIVIGYLDNSYYEEAIVLFIEMISQNNICDIISEFPSCVAVIVCIFKACVYSLNMGIGTQIHGFLLKLGVTDDYSVNVSLMNFYGKFGFLESSNSIFNQLCHRSTVIWTAKIVNNCREGYFNAVIKDFMEIGRSGVRRNSFTFSSVLKACARMNDDGHCGKQVHAIAIKLGVESNDFVQCGLIDMYSKCGIVRDAKRVFDVITDKAKTAHWNALLMGYVRMGCILRRLSFYIK